MVDQPVIPHWLCDDELGKSRMNDVMLCTFSPEVKKICQGDSGGGLVCLNSEGTAFVVAGIASYAYGCTEIAPSVFAAPSYMLDFVYSTMQSMNFINFIKVN